MVCKAKSLYLPQRGGKEPMKIDELVRVRNLIQSYEGQLLLSYLQDYITENACKNREASELKGMCELVQRIKELPALVEKKRSN